jgi:pimeloyl-ACP methyl ester carboxylesterase
MTSHWIQTSSETEIHAVVTTPSKHLGEATKCALLFIHYWGGSSRTWHKLTSPSSSTSLSNLYQTISIDLRGWGKSTGPNSDPEHTEYSIQAMASDVVSVLEQLQAEDSTKSLLENGIVIVGHSMGAKVALAATCSVRLRQLCHIRGLVLVAPAPPGALHLPEEMREQQQKAYSSEDSILWTIENVLSDTERLSASDTEQIVSDSLKGNVLAIEAWPLYGMGEDLSHALDEFSWLRESRNMPILILVGDLDIVEPRQRVESEVVEALRIRGLQSTLTVVPGVKHLMPLEAPEPIARVIFTVF